MNGISGGEISGDLQFYIDGNCVTEVGTQEYEKIHK